MQVQCASSLTDGISVFHSEINCQKSDMTYLYQFALLCDLGFRMIPKVRFVNDTKISKIQSVLQDFPEKFMESSNKVLCCNLCSCMGFCKKCFLVESYRNTSKHQKVLSSRPQLLNPDILQRFLRSSNTNFVKKVIKAILSVDIPLRKLNNKHIKNIFYDIDHSLPYKTTC